LAPAQLEGWDHLEGDTKFGSQIEKLCDSMQGEIQNRLGDSLVTSARGRPDSLVVNRHKYDCFAGGADTDRFRRAQWDKDKVENPGRTTPRITDPGPFPKPGWMYTCQMKEYTDGHGTKFDLPKTTPRSLSARG